MRKATPRDVAGNTLFEKLSDPVKTCLLSKAYVRDFRRGTVISFQGDKTNTLKLVVRGWVKLFRLAPNGDEAILQTLPKGKSFDEMTALETGRCTSSAETLSNCSILFIDLPAICSCPKARAELSSAVLLATSEHLVEMSDQVEQLKVKTAPQRLSSFLMEHICGESTTGEIELPYEKAVLAGKLGMKPESLSRAFKRLKEIGVCCDRNVVQVNDVPMLEAYSADDTAEACALA